MKPAIAFDLTRICYAPHKVSPRGVDRVDNEFARYFLTRYDGESVGVLPTPWGARVIDRKAAARMLAAVESRWAEAENIESDRAYAATRAALLRPEPFVGPHPRSGIAETGGTPRRMFDLLRSTGFHFGRSAIRNAPAGAVFLNTGHFGFALDRMLKWLPARPDVKPVFLLYDGFALTHPQHMTPGNVRFYRRAIDNALRHAAGLLTITEAARDEMTAALGAKLRSDLEFAAVPLAVSAPFDRPLPPDPQLAAAKPYFVFCAAIEPRKNLLLLLQVWSALAQRLGAKTPRLVIVGRRAVNAADTTDFLDNRPEIQPHVIETFGLANHALARLIAGSRALLTPSFAEGFGLPIVEGLSVGAPVVASDIPAHREAGGAHATYIDARDQAGWRDAILALLENPPTREKYRARTWDDYFTDLAPFLARVAALGR